MPNPVDKKTKPKSERQRKYPDYFYDNAPEWVGRLNRAKVQLKPNSSGNQKKHCGNCIHLKEIRTQAGEPMCGLINAAVRGHWYCSRWRLGKNQIIKLKPLSDEV